MTFFFAAVVHRFHYRNFTIVLSLRPNHAIQEKKSSSRSGIFPSESGLGLGSVGSPRQCVTTTVHLDHTFLIFQSLHISVTDASEEIGLHLSIFFVLAAGTWPTQ